MKIEDFEITMLREDGKPIKTKLPEELKERLYTKNQWLERKYKVKDDAVGYEMYSSMLGSKLFIYYLDTQVEKMTSEDKICATCTIRLNRFCPVAGDYVNMNGYCSNWCD